MTRSLVDALHRSRQLGFLGPGPVEAHIAHADAFASVISDSPARALDLGAGGGLPGLVLAVTSWPQTRWTFVDAQTKRTDALASAVADLGLDERVLVVNDRAEVIGREPSHRSGYDVVVARSFASPAVTAECAAPLLRTGGVLIVSEPPDQPPEDRWPTEGLALVGFGPATGHVVGGADPTHLVVIELAEAVPERFPRRVGVPTKRPLF